MAEDGETGYEPFFVESLQFGLQQIDMRAQEEAYKEERRKRAALRAKQENGSLSLNELAAARSRAEQAALEQAASGFGLASPAEVEPEKKAEPAARAPGRFPPPPTGGSR